MGSSSEQSEFDINNIATSLNGKADIDLTNVNNSGTSRGGSWAMPSTTYETLTIGASGATYTAPANGYYSAYLNGSGGGAAKSIYIDLYNTTSGIRSCINFMSDGSILQNVFMPCQKNDIVTYSFLVDSGTLVSNSLIFIYAQGSKVEVNE